MKGIRHLAFGIFAISIIAGLEVYALSLGHDGMVLAASIASITGISGAVLGFKLGKVTIEK